MVRVAIWGSLRAATDGEAEVEVPARNVHELLRELEARYPALAPQLARGVSVSIDGRIHARDRSATIAPDAEVVLLPRIVGG